MNERLKAACRDREKIFDSAHEVYPRFGFWADIRDQRFIKSSKLVEKLETCCADNLVTPYAQCFVFPCEMDYSFAREFRPTVALINKQSPIFKSNLRESL